MYVRHCPACRADYMPHVEVCADCGGALITRLEDEPLPGPEEEPGGFTLPPGRYLRFLSAPSARALEPSVKRLAQARVPCRVEFLRGAFDLLVRDEDRPAAREALQELLAGASSSDEALARHFDEERGAYTRCPACEAELRPGARECPDCGLELQATLQACPGCGAPLDPSDPRCPACGRRPESADPE